MQTFLPLPSFSDSARVLDPRRLGKQRVEAWQVLRVLWGETKGWRHHPTVLQWRGYEGALAEYGRAICLEWVQRGYADTMLDRFPAPGSPPLPPWLGDPAYHASHRAALLAKDPVWYGQFGWVEAPAVRDERGRLPYIWVGL